MRIELELALVGRRTPLRGYFDFETAGGERHAVSILEDRLAVRGPLAVVVSLHPRVVENAGKISSERAGGHRAIANELIDVAAVEARGAGPGVQFASVRYRHLEPDAIREFEPPRVARHRALIVAAIQSFDADILLEVLRRRPQTCASLLQHGVGIARRLGMGHGGRDK